MTRRRARWIVALAVAAAAVLAPPTAGAGGWFGIHIGPGGMGFSLGFSTWEPYTDAWYDPAWSLDFEAALAPYGEWVWVDGLGRVWRPYVTATWRPYTWGRWVWTDLGWTWVAYEPWGYIPHHFGHWALAPAGWVWVPGTVWRPAVVTWVSWGGYVGWYPTAPPGWRHAYRHGYDHGYRDGYRDGWHDARLATWVEWTGLAAENVATRAYRWSEVERRVPRGRIVPLSAGPERAAVERRLGRPLPTARLDRREVTVNGHRVTVARPVGVERDIARHARPVVERTLRPEVARRIERRAGSRTGTLHPKAGPRRPGAVRPRRGTPSGRAVVPRAASPRGTDTVRRPAVVPRRGTGRPTAVIPAPRTGRSRSRTLSPGTAPRTRPAPAARSRPPRSAISARPAPRRPQAPRARGATGSRHPTVTGSRPSPRARRPATVRSTPSRRSPVPPRSVRKRGPRRH